MRSGYGRNYTVLGIGAGIGSIITLGTNERLLSHTFNHLSDSKYTLAVSFFCLLKTINPEAAFPFSSSIYVPAIGVPGNGLITEHVSGALKTVEHSYYCSKNFFKRHVASRLTSLLLFVSSVITRIIDGVIGIIAAIFAIITLGKIPSLNNTACRGLQVTGIIEDCFYCVIKMINPF